MESPQPFLTKVKASAIRFFKDLAGLGDSPHRIAGGLGLGLFLGVFPGTGALASVFLAWLLRVNKPAALLGSLVVNTWINIVAFPLALLIGSTITGTSAQELALAWQGLFEAFSWSRLFDAAVLKTVLVLGLGYVAIGLVMGLIGYGIGRLVLDRFMKKPLEP